MYAFATPRPGLCQRARLPTRVRQNVHLCPPEQGGVALPVLYYTANVRGFDECGEYETAQRRFDDPSYELMRMFTDVSAGELQDRLADLYQQNHLVWLNNGLYFQAFNVFKEALWDALTAIRCSLCNFLLPHPTLGDRIACCKIAVELFGSFFQHHFPPSWRGVGSGVDVEWVPWPEERMRDGLSSS